MYKRRWQRRGWCYYLYLISVSVGLSYSIALSCSERGLAVNDAPRQIFIYLNSSLENIPDLTRLRAYRLIIQAFDELGYQVKFAYQPPKRIIQSIGAGNVEVACMRASGMENNRENIIRIPISVHQLRLYAYVDTAGVPASGLWWDASLESVALLHGAQDPKRYIPNEIMQKRIIKSPDRLTGARMVLAGRVDMVVFPEIIFHAYQASAQDVLSGLTKLEPALGLIETYCFLNRKQSHLLGPLTAILTRLKRELPVQFDDSLYPMVISDKHMSNMPSLPGYPASN